MDAAKWALRLFCQRAPQAPAVETSSVSLVNLLVPVRGTAVGSPERCWGPRGGAPEFPVLPARSVRPGKWQQKNALCGWFWKSYFFIMKRRRYLTRLLCHGVDFCCCSSDLPAWVEVHTLHQLPGDFTLSSQSPKGTNDCK